MSAGANKRCMRARMARAAATSRVGRSDRDQAWRTGPRVRVPEGQGSDNERRGPAREPFVHSISGAESSWTPRGVDGMGSAEDSWQACSQDDGEGCHSPRATMRDAGSDYWPRELRNHHVAIQLNSVLFPSFISHISSAQQPHMAKATVLDGTDLEHSQDHRKCYRTTLTWLP